MSFAIRSVYFQPKVRALSLEKLVTVAFLFGNQPGGCTARNAQMAEHSFFVQKVLKFWKFWKIQILKISEIYKNSEFLEFLQKCCQIAPKRAIFWHRSAIWALRFSKPRRLPKPRNPGTSGVATVTNFSSDCALRLEIVESIKLHKLSLHYIVLCCEVYQFYRRGIMP